MDEEKHWTEQTKDLLQIGNWVGTRQNSSKLGRDSSKLGRYKTKLSCRRCEHNWRPDKTAVLSTSAVWTSHKRNSDSDLPDHIQITALCNKYFQITVANIPALSMVLTFQHAALTGTVVLQNARILLDDNLRWTQYPLLSATAQHISGGSVNVIVLYMYGTLHVISREYPRWASGGDFPLPSSWFSGSEQPPGGSTSRPSRLLFSHRTLVQGSHASWKVLENGFGPGKSWKF